MAQHDYVIDNQTAPNFRSDLNNALLAIASNNSGSSAPSTTYANMIWYDTANNILKMRNEANDAWINIGTLNQTTDVFEVANLPTLAQATWEAGTGTTESLVSPAKVKAAIDALVPGGIGVGQTWQNVTASRTTGTAYQNTTGKPIMIAITRDSIGAESLEISTDGVSWSTILSTGAQGSDTARFQLIIPDQLYYRYNGGAAGTVDWWELR